MVAWIKQNPDQLSHQAFRFFACDPYLSTYISSLLQFVVLPHLFIFHTARYRISNLWEALVMFNHFVGISEIIRYTLSTQVSHSTLRCYTCGKIAEISMSRVTFANFNEMATYELSGPWSSQTSYYPSKLDVRSREQSDTANLAIGFEYKHFSVVCHEWYQALRLILFSHNNITIQRSTMQKTSLPVWLQMPCRWSLAIIHRTSNHVPVQTPPSASNRLHAEALTHQTPCSTIQLRCPLLGITSEIQDE